ncbi:MAG: (Fe-S)-binding protein [Thermoleophilia bacterium]
MKIPPAHDLVDQVYRCTRCGSCLAVCPSYLATGDESLGARGRISLAEAAVDGRLGPSSGLADRLSRCLGCGACAAICPGGLDPSHIIRTLKGFLVSETGPWKMARAAARRLLVSDFSPPATRRLPELSRIPTATSRVIFFPGCAGNVLFPDSGPAVVATLNAAGADVIVPRGLKCCGAPLLGLGEEDAVRTALSENLRVLSGIDADFIITACPACALILKEELPRLLGPARPDVQTLAAKVRELHQFLATNPVDTKRAPGTGDSGAPVRVTWHDPCHMRHRLGVTTGPREIIAGLPGVEFVESGQEQSCCGGGIFGLMHYDLAQNIGMKRVAQIVASGAEIVAT